MPKNQVKEPEVGNAQAPTAKADPVHPEVHPDRHPADGMQELPTSVSADPNPGGELSGGGSAGGAGAMQGLVDPNPGIGANQPAERPGGPGVNVPADDADMVFSYEQALLLPVVEEGTPVQAPSEAELKERHRKEHEERVRVARERTPEGEEPPAVPELPMRPPIVAFMDRDRRVMQVVRTPDGKLGAMPGEGFEEAPAPNAAA